MLCFLLVRGHEWGPIRFEVNPRKIAASRPFEHKLVLRETSFRRDADDSESAMSVVYTKLLANSA
jgi:hypothetical protein